MHPRTSSRFLCLCTSMLVASGCWETPSPASKPGPSPVPQSNAASQDGPTVAAAHANNPSPQPAPAPRPSRKIPPFQLVEVPVSQTQIAFVHVSGNAQDKPFPAANGSGGAAVDFDRDGLQDLYFATGTPFPLDPSRTTPINRVYRQLGDWKFTDVTAPAGLGHNGYSSGVATGDYDNDGFTDVFVTCFGDNVLYRNCGDGTFEMASLPPTGLFSTSAAFFDYDADGLLDLYVCNYGNWTYEENRYCGDRTKGVRIFCSPKTLQPEPHHCLHNDGDGTFHDVTQEAGLDAALGRGQGVLATDIDGDGRIDLYIGNDIHPNFMFINAGNGRFNNLTEISGAAYDRNGQMQAGMGVAAGDINRDGAWDLFVTNFEGEFHTLYLQSSPNDFQDVSATNGIGAPSKPWVGWGAAMLDLDLDAWKDLIVTNGHVDDNLKDMGRDSPYAQPGLVWLNTHDDYRFLGDTAGSYFASPHPGRGLARADVDNDGDWDIIITHQDQSPGLLRNDVRRTEGAPRDSIVLRLVGTASNRDGVGARVTVIAADPPRIEQIDGGGSYLSAHDTRVILAALGQSLDVELVWPSGLRTTLTGLQPGNQYDVVEFPQVSQHAVSWSHPLSSSPGKDQR
jgi:hypothetical protein